MNEKRKQTKKAEKLSELGQEQWTYDHVSFSKHISAH